MENSGDDEIIIITPEDLILVNVYPQDIDLTLLDSQDADAIETEMILLTNREREQHGLKPLQRNEVLMRSALLHTLDMAENRFISHTGSDGSTLATRALHAGTTRWAILGENVACGQQSAVEVVQGWMNSPGHRANILHEQYEEIGVAYINGLVMATDGTWVKAGYWTQHFGAQWSIRRLLPPGLRRLPSLSQDGVEDEVYIQILD